MKRDQRYLQGKFENLKHPEKYIGKKSEIFYRSAPERRFFLFCDNNENILHWSSEEVVVRYFHPFKKTISRYFIDFFIELKNHEKILIEYKPSKQTKVPRKNCKNYEHECGTYLVNQSKWSETKKIAESKGMKFVVMTEKDFDGNSTDKKILEAIVKVLKNF